MLNISSVLSFRDDISGLPIYEINQYQIQKYNDNYYKMIRFKRPTRRSGYELPFDKDKSQKGTVNEDKLNNNIRRAVNKIFEYSMCNEWDYFCTFTIDGEKHPRDNLKKFYSGFSKWLQDYQRTHGKIKYVFIPELHKDKVNWHFHGLIKIENNNLSDFDYTNEKYSIKKQMKLQILHKKGYKNWSDYENKYGFCSFGVIQNQEAVSRYVTKYVTKSLYGTSDGGINKIAMNQQLYYCSKGLNEKEIIKKDDYANCTAYRLDKKIDYDFENEYVSIKLFNKETIANII